MPFRVYIAPGIDCSLPAGWQQNGAVHLHKQGRAADAIPMQQAFTLKMTEDQRHVIFNGNARQAYALA